MKRRTMITMLGGLTAAGASAVGTGAFGYTRADRKVNVQVADDDAAFLYMDPNVVTDENGEITMRSTDPGELIQFDIPGYEENDDVGLGSDSKYTFEALFDLGNQGSEPVQVYSIYDDDLLADVAIHHDGEEYRENNPSETLSPGDRLTDVGLHIDTSAVAPGQKFTTTISIVAKKPGTDPI